MIDAWPATRIGRLCSLWNNKLSTLKIAEVLTSEFPHLPKVSKSACIGKAHRLLLSKRPSPIIRKSIATQVREVRT